MSGHAKYSALLPEFQAPLSQEVEHVDAKFLASDASLYCIIVMLGHNARNSAIHEVLDRDLMQPIIADRQAVTALGTHTELSSTCVRV